MNANPSIPTTQEINDQLGQVISHINAARALVEQGDAVNLDGLDSVVDTLCKNIQRMPVDAQAKCESPLIIMIDEFNRLTKALEEQRDSLAGDLKDMSKNVQAATAYGTGTGKAK